MIDGLKYYSRLALFNEFFMVGRRILLLYPAMFIVGKSWLHTLLYIHTNMFFLAYLGGVRPNVEPHKNYLHIFNELTSLLIAYFITAVNNPANGPESNV